MNSSDTSSERTMIFFPNENLVEPFIDFLLVYFLLNHLTTAARRATQEVDESGFTFLAIVLWFFLGRFIYKIYRFQLKSNPRVFPSQEAAQEFVREHAPEQIGWVRNGSKSVFGIIVLVFAWDHVINAGNVILKQMMNQSPVAGLFDFAFWIVVLGIGWRSLSSGVDKLAVNYWRCHMVN